MTELNTSRRTLVKGAAWAVPAVTVAAAAPALAASPTCEATYQEVTKTFQYKDVLGGIVTVAVTAKNIPLTAPAGASLLPIETTSIVTIPSSSAGLLTSLLLGGATQVDGKSNSTSDLTGAVTDSQTTALTITRTSYTSGSDLVLNAAGTGTAGSIPTDAQPGQVIITMGEPSSDLVGYNDAGGETGRTTTTLSKIAGNDYVLATFEVVTC